MPFAREALVVSAVACASPTAHAQASYTLAPVADVTLYESASGAAANGAGEHLFTGLTLRNASLRRCLLRFDLSSIAPGEVIVGARLRMEVTRSNGGPADLRLHRASAPWSQGASNAFEPGGQGTDPAPGDATWIHRAWPSAFWATPGGEFSSVVSASALSDGVGPIEWTAGPVMLADLEAWRSDPSQNFGWLIESIGTDTNSARCLASRENVTPSVRPVLEIETLPLCAACRADFNCDGGVDGDDVIAFFAEWDENLIGADVTDDGLVDGDDVIAFFARWDAGC